VKRPTILLLITTFDMGGAERVYVQLALGLAHRGYRVIAACLQRRSGHVAEELKNSSVEILDLAMSSKSDFGATWRLVQFLRHNRVDVVYTFLIHSHVVGRLAARLCKVPVLISSQQVMLIENRFRKWANRFTARWCDAVVAVSRSVEEYLIHDVGVPRAKIVTIYNAIETELFEGINPRPFDAGNPGPFIGYCARLRTEKDHQGLIKAMKLVKARFPDARLLLAGDGPEREKLEQFVKSERMTESVAFLGQVRSVSAFYAGVDIYVQSSCFEGLPLAILEALACSLPVVATRVAGNVEIIEDRKNGLLVEPRDPEALGEAIVWMAAHRGEARQMGVNGRRVVRDRFGARAMVAATDDLIMTLSKAAGRGRIPHDVQCS
jgi:glycosyltransferase involved in cell wall biosynthesis